MNTNRVNILINSLKYLETATNPKTSDDIAAVVGMTSVEDLQQSLRRLSKLGVLKTFRGPNGGFKLVKPLADVMYLDLAYALRYRKISDPLFQRAYGMRIEVPNVV